MSPPLVMIDGAVYLQGLSFPRLVVFPRERALKDGQEDARTALLHWIRARNNKGIESACP